MYSLWVVFGYYERLFQWLEEKRRERPVLNGLLIALSFFGSVFLLPWLLKPIIPFGVLFMIGMALWGPLLFLYSRRN